MYGCFVKLSGAPGASRSATNQIAATAKRIVERSKAIDFLIPRAVKATMVKAASDPHRNCEKNESMFQYGSHCFAPPVKPYCQPFKSSPVMNLSMIQGFNNCSAMIQVTSPAKAKESFFVLLIMAKRTIGRSK